MKSLRSKCASDLPSGKLAFPSGLAIGLVTITLLLSGCQAVTPASPQPAPADTGAPLAAGTTEVPASLTYDWRGTTLTLAQPLPASPAEAGVFLSQPETHATPDTARALADQFGMQGQIYEMPSELSVTGSTDILIVDGNQRLSVRSDRYFSYYPNYPEWKTGITTVDVPDVKTQIDAFMRAHGFDFEYKIEPSGLYGAYFVLPLSTDGLTLHYDFFKANGLLFSFSDSGIISVDASLMKNEHVGEYGIITAEEALQKILDPDLTYGTLESFDSPFGSVQAWNRHYPKDQTVTIYGYMNSVKSLEGGKPLVTLDGYAVIDNLSGINETTPNTFIEATGKFHSENNVDRFVLESWKVFDDYAEGLLGTLQREGDQAVLTTIENARLVLPDVPSDVPLPLEDVYVMGVTRGDTFEWSSFDMRDVQGGGGGGGGGLGFYKLNLTGTPMPLPTLLPQTDQSGQAIGPFQLGRRLEGQRGLLSVILYNQSDGSQRAEYNLYFIPEGQPFSYSFLLEGADLQALQEYQNRPVEIWGSIDRYDDQRGMDVVKVDRFEIPFPDLQFQILRGTQKIINVSGQNVTLFTAEDGQSYVQFGPGGDVDNSLIGVEGDQVLVEALAIPDETFGGYATLRVFSAAMATSPKNGQPETLSITADQPYVTDEPNADQLAQDSYVAPTATIESVELVYFIVDPRYALPDPSADPAYIQPMWRFYGHYSNGDEFEILVQALQDQFLSPEIQVIEGPG
jgi:hypothetical protein